MSRALRRHHRQRLKHARKAYWSYDRLDPMSPATLGKIVDTPHPCSKECCGNPRRQFGARTRRERVFYAEEIIESLAVPDTLEGTSSVGGHHDPS